MNIRRVTAALLVVAVALVAGIGGAGAALADDPVQVVVNVKDSNFDPTVVEVAQGSLVKLTFNWDHVAYPSEEHVIVLEGYKLETPELTPQNKSVTLEFVANKVGEFGFFCDVECETHDFLQKGKLKVGAGASGGGGGSTQLKAAAFTVDPSAGVAVRRGIVTVSTYLRGPEGEAIPDADVQFLMDATFAGTSGTVEIGTAKTDATGLARLTYTPAARGAFKLIASSEAVGTYDKAELAIDVRDDANFSSSFADEETTLGNFKLFGEAGLALIILIVWAGFGVILWLVWSVRRVQARETE